MVGVIAVLLGFLLPALGAVGRGGRAVAEAAAARQLMVAYGRYAAEHRDAVLPGYKVGLTARDERGLDVGEQTIPQVPARYPWRLAPYLDYTLEGLYLNESRRLLEEMKQTERGNYLYVVSLSPSLGLNSTWVGGDDTELGFDTRWIERYGAFYVTRNVEVKRPNRLLVFASARGVDPLQPAAGSVEGFYRVRSPYLSSSGYRWSDAYEENEDPGDYGNLSMRYNDQAVVAFMDGHVGTLDAEELKDMRHWANNATTEDYTLRPR